MGTASEVDVGAVGAGELQEAPAVPDSDDDQGGIAPSFPSAPVRGSEEGVDLLWFDESDLAFVAALLRDGQHLGDEAANARCGARGESEQRTDGGQAGFAGLGSLAVSVSRWFRKAEMASISMPPGSRADGTSRVRSWMNRTRSTMALR